MRVPFIRNDFEENDSTESLVLFLYLANDPNIERKTLVP